VFSAQRVAYDLVHYSNEGYFGISTGLDGWLLKQLHPGMSPANHLLEVGKWVFFYFLLCWCVNLLTPCTCFDFMRKVGSLEIVFSRLYRSILFFNYNFCVFHKTGDSADCVRPIVPSDRCVLCVKLGQPGCQRSEERRGVEEKEVNRRMILCEPLYALCYFKKNERYTLSISNYTRK